jgi:transposase
MKHDTVFGMDVHARTVTICAIVIETGETQTKRFNSAAAGEIAEWMYGFKGSRYAAYESGCTGFHLCRELRELGIPCDVIAVSTLARSSDDRKNKSDKVDARRIAQEMAKPLTDYSTVYVPDKECEGMRDLVRMRDDAKKALKIVGQQLSALLLRHGYVWNERTKSGKLKAKKGKDYKAWLNAIVLPGASGEALDAYRAMAADGAARVSALDKKIKGYAAEPRWKPVVDALCCLKGVDIVSAFAYAVEFDDFSRFKNGRSVSKWAGLTPTQDSSGEKVNRTGKITRAGSRSVRLRLIEGTNTISLQTTATKAPLKGQVVSERIRQHAKAGSLRMRERYISLTGRNKQPNIAKAAIASELVRWIWAIGSMAQDEMACRQQQGA